jgi:hypothetical protein
MMQPQKTKTAANAAGTTATQTGRKNLKELQKAEC